MFQSVLGALSAGVAIDVGTAHTRIHVAGRGVVIDTPTVVAILEDRHGGRRIVATGRDAARMQGRAPDDIRVVRPVQDGAIVDYEVTEAFLRLLMMHVHGRRLWVGPHVVMAIPPHLAELEVRVIKETVQKAGARTVDVVERPIAAALGAGLPIDDACGHMVIDVGASGTTVSVLSLGEIVYSMRMPVGGDHMDTAIIDQLRDTHGLLISAESAEGLRRSIGGALPDVCGEAWVRGRELSTGWPRALAVDAHELRGAIRDTVQQVASGALSALERIAPDLAADVAETGIVLTGGAAHIPGVDIAVGELTGLPVVAPEHPEHAVVAGCANALPQVSGRRALA